MTTTTDREIFDRLTLDDLEGAICEREPSYYRDHKDWARDCHSVSLEIVRSGLFKQARVARGACLGVGGQHSWVSLGDPYDDLAPLLDATLWSYDPTKPVLWKGTMADGLHQPKGYGWVYDGRRPRPGGGPEIQLAAAATLSAEAQEWLTRFGPLDIAGWAQVASLPVGGWPAREIIEAMLDTPGLGALVPIDIAGMLTDRNPGGLYLATPEQA